MTFVTVITVEDHKLREAREAAYQALHQAAGTSDLTFSPFLVAREEPRRRVRRVLADDQAGRRFVAELVEAVR